MGDDKEKIQKEVNKYGVRDIESAIRRQVGVCPKIGAKIYTTPWTRANTN
jgi:hypothetical protein